MLALLAEEAVHGRVVADDDVVLHVGLGGAEAELDQGDLGILDLAGPAGGLLAALVKYNSVHELGVVDGTSDLLHHPDVPEVDVLGCCGVNDSEDTVDSNGGKDLRVLGYNLTTEAGGNGVDKGLAVGEVDGLGDILEDGLGALAGAEEGGGDLGGVDSLGGRSRAMTSGG